MSKRRSKTMQGSTITVQNAANTQGIVRMKCEQFNPETTDLEVWTIKFLANLELQNITDEKIKRNLFIDGLNVSALSTLLTLCKPHHVNDFTFNQLLDILTAHFKPVKLKIVERVNFFSCKQGNDDLQEYIVHLKQQATACEFPANFFEDALITAFVMGITDSEIRLQLLQRDYSSFEEVVTACKTLKSVRSITSHNDSWAVSSKLTCFSCGEKHLRKNCRFREAICNYCKIRGHTSKICKKRLKELNTHQSSNMVNDKASEENQPANPQNLDVFAVQSSAQAPIFIPVRINNVQIRMLLDTGSCVSIITSQTWEYLDKFPLKPSQNIYSSYSGHQVDLLGEQYVQVRYKDVSDRFLIQVARNARQNILGRDWLAKLNITSFTLHSLIKGNDCLHVSVLSGDCSGVKQNSNSKLHSVLQKFSSLFEPGIGECSTYLAHLYLKENAIPIFKKARPVPFALISKVNDEIGRLVDAGVLEPVEYSDWAAPCVIVRKPNGKIRLCADFSTGLNSALNVQVFPLPTPDEIFSKLNGGKTFSTLDMSDAYLTIPLDAESQKLVTINTIKGLFRYKRLCFGVAPAPSIFQKTMDTMLKGLQGVSYYLDDIIITGSSDEEHLQHLQEVLERIRKFGFKINKDKCKFMQDSVQYLGVTVSKDGIQTSKDKVKAIVNMPDPTDLKNLESFLGMVTYYSKFIPNFADICYPLNRLKKKDVPWSWSQECENAVKTLKSSLTEAPILTLFNPVLPLVVAADASSVGIGCSLLHRFPDSSEKPIAYASKTLTETERKYSQIEREALSIIFAVKKFKQYLLGREFILQTDHRPLLTIFGSKKGIPTTTACRLQRWALFLTTYSFKMEFIPTHKFGKADGLSRLPQGYDREFDKEDGGFQTVVSSLYLESQKRLPLTHVDIQEETTLDATTNKLTEFIQHGWPDKCDEPSIKPYFRKRHELSMHQGCIYWGIRILIPKKFQFQILEHLHETHAGVVRMKSEARNYVWWPRIDADIEQIGQNCRACNTFARDQSKKAFLTPWPSSERPWSRIHIDFAGPFFHKMLFLVVDSFSKWVEVLPVTSTTAESTTNALKALICRYGIPETIVSDNGPTFISQTFANFCSSFAIKHVTTPTYHPSSNGQVEKYVHSVKQALKKLKWEVPQTKFSDHLQNFLFRYRTTPHVSTNETPANLFLGRKIRTRLDLIKPIIADERKRTVHEMKIKTFIQGEKIYTRDYRQGRPPWQPAVVEKRCGKNTWIVKTEDGIRHKRHADQLRK